MTESSGGTGTPVRRESWFLFNAQEYVGKQLDVMSKYGSVRILSPAEYDSLVDEVMRIGMRLWLASGGSIERP